MKRKKKKILSKVDSSIRKINIVQMVQTIAIFTGVIVQTLTAAKLVGWI